MAISRIQFQTNFRLIQIELKQMLEYNQNQIQFQTDFSEEQKECIHQFDKLLKNLSSYLEPSPYDPKFDSVRLYLNLILMQLHIIELEEILDQKIVPEFFSGLKNYRPENLSSISEDEMQSFFKSAETFLGFMKTARPEDSFNLFNIQKIFSEFEQNFFSMNQKYLIKDQPLFRGLVIKIKEKFNAQFYVRPVPVYRDRDPDWAESVNLISGTQESLFYSGKQLEDKNKKMGCMRLCNIV